MRVRINPYPLSPGEGIPSSCWIGSWMGQNASLRVAVAKRKISYSCWVSNPSSPTHTPSNYNVLPSSHYIFTCLSLPMGFCLVSISIFCCFQLSLHDVSNLILHRLYDNFESSYVKITEFTILLRQKQFLQLIKCSTPPSPNHIFLTEYVRNLSA